MRVMDFDHSHALRKEVDLGRRDSLLQATVWPQIKRSRNTNSTLVDAIGYFIFLGFLFFC